MYKTGDIYSYYPVWLPLHNNEVTFHLQPFFYLASVLLNQFTVLILDLCCLTTMGYVYTLYMHSYMAIEAEDEISELIFQCTNCLLSIIQVHLNKATYQCV